MKAGGPVFLILLLLFAASALKADAVTAFDSAVASGQAGDYDRALLIFESLRDSGYVSPELFYNLGNCYYKTGHKGLAVASYLQAQRLDPRNHDIEANLLFVRSTLRDKYQDSIQNPIWKALKDSALYFKADELTWMAFGFYLMIVAILIFKVFYKRRSIVVLVALLFFTLVLTASASLLATNIRLNYYTPQAVITAQEVDILAAPGALGDIRFTAHEGLVFRILKQQSGYFEGIFANNLKGWIDIAKVSQY